MYYLKENVLVEPLVAQWYAWPYLISPATAAMSTAHLHMPLMKSFIQAPALHARAAKNRKLLGGRFMGLGKDKLADVRALMEATQTQDGDLLALAAAITELEQLVAEQAKGYSVEALYEQVPEPLKGYVEIIYDLNNQPSVRFLESMMYRGPLYKTDRQALLFSLITDDHREFSLASPRFAEENHFQLQIPFAHKGLDRLFAMRTTPATLGEIQAALDLTEEQTQQLLPFLTETRPHQAEPYRGDDVRVRYYGHATVLVETADVSILVDPAISYRYPNGIERYDFSDLPEKIDYVLITHNHQDHCLLETLLQLRHRIGCLVVPRNGGGSLVDPSLKVMFRELGFDQVLEIGELDEIPVKGGMISGIPFLGEHADLNILTRLAFLVRLHNRDILFAADSRNLEPRMYQHLHRIYGDIDLLFLGMECDGAPLSWLYGPLMTRPLERKMDQSRRLNGSDFEKAMALVEDLGAKQVFVYALGQEPWLNYIMSVAYDDNSGPIVESNKLLAACEERGIPVERLFGTRELILTAQAEAAVVS